MDTSILNSTKKILGLVEADTTFDLDIITHINSAFSTITDLGLGPADGFVIEDEEADWADFDADLMPVQLSQVKTFVFLTVRLAFDPPQTSFALSALQEQIREHSWRLNVRREATEWVDPDPVVVVDE